MKNFFKSAFCTVLITLLVLTAITAGVAMLLIPAVIGTPEAPAGESVSGIEYSSAPQNQALLVTDEAGRGALIYLNFEDITTHVYLFEEGAAENAALLPFNVTYRMKLPPDFAGRLCDRLGGIDLEIDGKTERYFSSSLSEFLSDAPDYEKLLIITKKFFEKIANIGLSSEDFMFIIELTDTDLTYSVCYGWINRISELCGNCVYH